MNSDIKQILQRNKDVEMEKSWEISWVRRIILAAGTYLIVGSYLSVLGVAIAWLHAIVPPAAYIVSTLTLPIFKKIYLKKRFSDENK